MVSTFAPLMTGAYAAASALIAVAVASAVNENSPAVKLSKDSLVVKMISSLKASPPACSPIDPLASVTLPQGRSPSKMIPPPPWPPMMRAPLPIVVKTACP